MVNRPSLLVRAVRLTAPDTEVAVTWTPSIGRLSGPVTRPRMTSVCWARAAVGIARTIAKNANVIRRRVRMVTLVCGMKRRTTADECAEVIALDGGFDGLDPPNAKGVSLCADFRR